MNQLSFLFPKTWIFLLLFDASTVHLWWSSALYRHTDVTARTCKISIKSCFFAYLQKQVVFFSLTDFRFCVNVSKSVFLFICPPGSGSVQARGGLLQHEGGDPVTRLRPGLFRKLRGRGHACPPPPGKMRQRDRQLQSQRRVHHRARSNRTGAF